MARHILRCTECKRYTLKESCSCGGKAVQNIPPKYSPDDQYARYRREAKKEQREKDGLL